MNPPKEIGSCATCAPKKLVRDPIVEDALKLAIETCEFHASFWRFGLVGWMVRWKVDYFRKALARYREQTS
jgi:hypothetical protein